ncbi:MAG: 23S rRNA (pseudouridine(1915)-N(3))-methyltransferase RlmH [Pigmentiphaga sp.]|nr:23S rRNA (pseudouridine(1915)-N(3))-methyltransferase RlmH [Pigmentiphaga sp.]
MRLILAAVGTRMPDWVTTGYQEYARRLPADCPLELREVKAEPRAGGRTAAQLMQAEARRLEAALPASCQRVALDERGRDWTTQDLAQALERWRADGRDVAFLIGGADGLEPVLKQGCEQRLRLSSLTLPHAMVRVLLAEQLYRAWSILHNHPYHRA